MAMTATTTTTGTTSTKTTLSHAQKTVLAMSRAQYLSSIRATRPADALYVGVCVFRRDAHSSRPSVLLLHRPATATPSNPSSSSAAARRGRRRHGRQRGSGDEGTAADDGGWWELPGGRVRDSDCSISEAAARRVEETTGLRVTRVLGALRDVRRVGEARVPDWDDEGGGGGSNMLDDPAAAGGVLEGDVLGSLPAPRGGNARSGNSKNQPAARREHLQLNYAVLVQGREGLAVRGGDYDELVWASSGRVEALRLPEQLRAVARQGLAFAGECVF
ncbi:hypothetical protein GGR52DRAFT_252558 [Hypoxylon sp. FL1284]|nr:hypothetical protein GGR52DRAFT_252558 [Hypoxylon sp. FL1284]